MIVSEFGMNAGRAVRFARTAMDRADPRRQCNILERWPRRRTLQPRIESAGGDPQQPAHHPNRIGGLVRFHEIEDRFEFTAVS